MIPQAAGLAQQMLGVLGGGALAAVAIAMVRARSQELGIRTVHERSLLEQAILRIDSLERQLTAEQEARRQDRARCDAEMAALGEQLRKLERQLLQPQRAAGQAQPAPAKAVEAVNAAQRRRVR